MCLKSMHIPCLVAVSAPEKEVPPEYAVTGICRREQIFMISLTSDVLRGVTTMAGTCEAGAGDQGVDECALRTSTSDVTQSELKAAMKSLQAAFKFSFDKLYILVPPCPGGLVECTFTCLPGESWIFGDLGSILLLE